MSEYFKLQTQYCVIYATEA